MTDEPAGPPRRRENPKWIFFGLAAVATLTGIVIWLWAGHHLARLNPWSSEEEAARFSMPPDLPIASAGKSLPEEVLRHPPVLITSRPRTKGDAVQAYRHRLPFASLGDVGVVAISTGDLATSKSHALRDFIETHGGADGGSDLALLPEPDLPCAPLLRAIDEASDAGITRFYIGCLEDPYAGEIVFLPMGLPGYGGYGPPDHSSVLLFRVDGTWRYLLVSDLDFEDVLSELPRGVERYTREEMLRYLKLHYASRGGKLFIGCMKEWTVQDFVDALDLGLEAGCTEFALPRVPPG